MEGKLKVEVDYSERGTSQWEQKAQNKLLEMATVLYENPRNFEFRYQNDNYNYKIIVEGVFTCDGQRSKSRNDEAAARNED